MGSLSVILPRFFLAFRWNSIIVAFTVLRLSRSLASLPA